MTASARSLLDQALELPDEERESIALALLDSIHGPADDGDVAAEWAAEIRRRVDDYKSGRVGSVAWEDLRDELRARVRGA